MYGIDFRMPDDVVFLADCLSSHALVGSTVRSYLAWLKDTGRLTFSIQDIRLLWQRV